MTIKEQIHSIYRESIELTDINSVRTVEIAADLITRIKVIELGQQTELSDQRVSKVLERAKKELNFLINDGNREAMEFKINFIESLLPEKISLEELTALVTLQFTENPDLTLKEAYFNLIEVYYDESQLISIYESLKK